MNTQLITTAARYLASMAVGWLVSHHVLATGVQDTVAAGIIALMVVSFSVVEKIRAGELTWKALGASILRDGFAALGTMGLASGDQNSAMAGLLALLASGGWKLAKTTGNGQGGATGGPASPIAGAVAVLLLAVGLSGCVKPNLGVTQQITQVTLGLQIDPAPAADSIPGLRIGFIRTQYIAAPTNETTLFRTQADSSNRWFGVNSVTTSFATGTNAVIQPAGGQLAPR